MANLYTKVKLYLEANSKTWLNEENNKSSGKAKLKTGEALNDAEIDALFG